MTTRPALPVQTFALAAVLAACLQPALAQRGGTTTQTDPYNAQVDPLPSGCIFIGDRRDGPPRSRPVAVQLGKFPDPAPMAQALPRIDPSPLVRQVAFSYTFSNLGLKIPSDIAGVFYISSVRTTVHMGPTTAYPVASDRTISSVNSVSWTSSATETRALLSVPFNNTWLVRNISHGRWQNDAATPGYLSTVGFDCLVTVRPPTMTVGP
jgi:hypothetical protein